MSEAQHTSRVSELREYPDGLVDEMFKVPGTHFGMDELAARVENDPEARDVGCVYVQTVEDNGTRNRYYFDGVAMADPQANRVTMLGTVDLSRPDLAITVGESWNSPLGPTKGKVQVVATPWRRGYDSEATVKGNVSPMTKGRSMLNWAAEQAGDQSGMSPDKRAALGRALGAAAGAMGTIADGSRKS